MREEREAFVLWFFSPKFRTLAFGGGAALAAEGAGFVFFFVLGMRVLFLSKSKQCIHNINKFHYG